MKVVTYVCDACLGAIVNTDGAWMITRVDDHSPLFTVRPWDKSQLSKATGHACTRKCAEMIVAQFLETATVKTPPKQDVSSEEIFRLFFNPFMRPPKDEDEE